MKKILLLIMMFAGTYVFSQVLTTFNAGYMQFGEWDADIEDYDIVDEVEDNISIEVYEDYFIFETNKDRTKVYHEYLEEESDDDQISIFYLEDFDGEEAMIMFNEEEEVIIYLFGEYDDEIETWIKVIIISDIDIE